MNSEQDPTRTGSPVPPAAGAAQRLSVSEIQMLCLKAARGTGFSWGLAEEAGWAAAWLAQAGLPGAVLLLSYLTSARGSVPVPQPGEWRAPDHSALCPIATGAALSDFAFLPEGITDVDLVLQRVRSPGLLLPFAARIAKLRTLSFTLTLPDTQAVFDPQGRMVLSKAQSLDQAEAAAVILSTGAAPEMITLAAPPLPLLDHDTWTRLDRLALLTTVPPSSQSRAGAGGRGSDND